VFSLNVPVPGEVARLASDLHPRLVGFETVRERHTLVCKRFETERGTAGDDALTAAGDDALPRLRERLRPVLAGTPAFEARVVGVDAFEQPARGSGPVVYLRVESPGLRRLHRRLTDAFGVVDGLEGDDYVPHITLARGSAGMALDDLREWPVEPVAWTVSTLVIWDSRYREPVARYGLPL
jgi:hypothetical protein